MSGYETKPIFSRAAQDRSEGRGYNFLQFVDDKSEFTALFGCKLLPAYGCLMQLSDNKAAEER